MRMDLPSPSPWSRRSPPDAAKLWPLRDKACSWIDCGYACQKPKRLDDTLDILTFRCPIS